MNSYFRARARKLNSDGLSKPAACASYEDVRVRFQVSGVGFQVSGLTGSTSVICGYNIQSQIANHF